MAGFPEHIFDLIDAEQLALLPSLELRARALAHGVYTGMHKSPFRGTNAEFKEFREYFRGDPVNDIDWKVYARTNHLVVRLREDSTDLGAAIFMDASASMAFRDSEKTLSKWDYAATIAAACMLILSEQKDRFSLMVPGHDEMFEKPSNTQAHLSYLLKKLGRKPDLKEFPLKNALMDAVDTLQNGAPVILLSDFYFPASDLENLLTMLAAKHCTPLLFRVMTRSEYDFPYSDAVRFQDMETEERLAFSPDSIRREYHEALNRHIEEFDHLAISCRGCHHVFLTDTLPVEALGMFLATQGKRAGR